MSFTFYVRNEDSIKPRIKPARFLKPGRFDSKVLEVIKSSSLRKFN
jgi:hypothetical protein